MNDFLEYNRFKEGPFKLSPVTLSRILTDKADSWRFVRQGDVLFIDLQDENNHRNICLKAGLDKPEDGGYFQTIQSNIIRMPRDVSDGLANFNYVSKKIQEANRPETVKLFKKLGREIEGFDIIFI